MRGNWGTEHLTQEDSQRPAIPKLIMLTSVNAHLLKKGAIWTVWESKRCDGQKRNQWIPALVSNWPTDHPSGESLTGKLVGWTLATRLNCALFQLCNGLILALQPNSRPKTCPLLPIRKSHVTQAMDAFTLGDKSNSELSHLNIESQKKISLKGKTEERKRKAIGLPSSPRNEKWGIIALAEY